MVIDMHIGTIHRMTPEWPSWRYGPTARQFDLWDPESTIEQGKLFWTRVEGTLYSLTWSWADWITAKHYDLHQDGFQSIYDKSIFDPADARTLMREIMEQFPSYLVRWRL